MTTPIELTRFAQDMDGGMEPEEFGEWVRFYEVEALQADAERLAMIYKNLEFDGSYWLPEWCVKECFNVQYAVAPSFEEFCAAIDARKDQP